MNVIVRKGDSLSYYSQLFSIPLPLLSSSNEEQSTKLVKGNVINIPGYMRTEYKLGEKDTFYSVAKEKDLDVDALMLLNPNLDYNNLPIGKTITVPTRCLEPTVRVKQGYHYSHFVEDLIQLKTIFPFIKVASIGQSVLGNELYEIKIGNGNKKIHMNGSFHANEWITTSVIMQFINDFLLGLTNRVSIHGCNLNALFDEVTLSIVPMVNPDGVNLVLNNLSEEEIYFKLAVEINNGSKDFSNWKANIRGIDLNNQYPSYWEIEKERKEPKRPAPRDYPGDHPLTEPEAIAIAQLTKNSDFSRIIAFHTQGKEIYWGYLNNEPPIAEQIVNEFERVSGYKAVRDIDSHAGYRDWFILTFKRAGYTVELGEGINPLPITQFDEIYEQSIGIFLASLYM